MLLSIDRYPWFSLRGHLRSSFLQWASVSRGNISTSEVSTSDLFYFLRYRLTKKALLLITSTNISQFDTAEPQLFRATFISCWYGSSHASNQSVFNNYAQRQYKVIVCPMQCTALGRTEIHFGVRCSSVRCPSTRRLRPTLWTQFCTDLHQIWNIASP